MNQTHILFLTDHHDSAVAIRRYEYSASYIPHFSENEFQQNDIGLVGSVYTGVYILPDATYNSVYSGTLLTMFLSKNKPSLNLVECIYPFWGIEFSCVPSFAYWATQYDVAYFRRILREQLLAKKTSLSEKALWSFPLTTAFQKYVSSDHSDRAISHIIDHLYLTVLSQSWVTSQYISQIWMDERYFRTVLYSKIGATLRYLYDHSYSGDHVCLHISKRCMFMTVK